MRGNNEKVNYRWIIPIATLISLRLGEDASLNELSSTTAEENASGFAISRVESFAKVSSIIHRETFRSIR